MKLSFGLQIIKTFRYARRTMLEQFAEYNRMYKKAKPTVAKRLEKRVKKLEIEYFKYYKKI